MTYDEFEMIIPRCFRDDRQSFLNHIDNKIDDIYRRTTTVENDSVGVTRKLIDFERPIGGSSIAGQSVSENSSDFDYDVMKFIHREKQLIPQKFHRITDGNIAREKALRLIQSHIRAMRDRVIVNESMSL